MTDAEFYDSYRRWERGEIGFAEHIGQTRAVPLARALRLLDEWLRWVNMGFLSAWAILALVAAACVIGPMLGWLPGWVECLSPIPVLLWLTCVLRRASRVRRLNAQIREYMETHP